MLILVLIIYISVQLAFLLANYMGCEEAKCRPYNSFLLMLAFVFFLGLFFIRTHQFGADTKNYLYEFSVYCSNGNQYEGVDYTYNLTFYLIDSLMLKTCQIEWLIWIWPLIIVSAFFCAIFILKADIIYMIAFFSSFIGIELLTNAMRQGISISLLIIGFSFYFNRRFLFSFIFLCLSMLFHTASLITVVIFIVSRINYKLLVPSLFLCTYFIFFTSYLSFVPGLDVVISSVLKYMIYTGDDFIVRLISVADVFISLLVFFLLIRRDATSYKKIINILINVFYICVLLSFVPYLGFRVIYGVYPIMLMMICFYLKQSDRNLSYIYLSLMVFVNSTITIMWLFGSSHMNSIPFVELP